MCVKMHIVNEDSPCYVTPFAPEEVAASRVGREKKLGMFFGQAKVVTLITYHGNHMR